ncbi:putative MFS family arabinose efflux permease [Nonomuraea thailandensis]|uniref:MFS family arabinose efflux permease n=1 Tax=Nonomuraea thailandensis TaxID=1188745 RepID=A0A9X2GR95_9ACTN|nr:MFS transporter [Nonomuraea thailandensis]MCP2361984.1 putative MFS family arabinose efflux permease [Nonomuraea thailandensis]
MLQTFFPQDRVARSLTLSTMAFALSSGVFYTVSTLYFTLVIGLGATTVGLGLGIAGGTGVLAAYAGGWLADRVGAHHVQTVATGLNGVALLAYTFVSDAVMFTLIACLAVIMRSAGSSSKQAMLARWYTGPERVEVRARMRVVTNVFIGLGTVAAAAALLIGTAAAYRVAVSAAGVLLLAATVPLAGLGRRVPELAARMTAVRQRAASTGPSPLRDRTYLASVACNTVMAVQFGLMTVGVPLWVATTGAPTAIVSVLLVLNTAVVAALQVRVSRGTDDVRTAGLTVRRASWLLAIACGLYALAGYGNVIVACALFVLAAFAHTMGEILGEAGGWGMAFELADQRSAGAYQGLSQTGYAIAAMFSPILATTVVEHGTVGWACLAVLFVLAGTGAAAVARRPAGLVHEPAR